MIVADFEGRLTAKSSMVPAVNISNSVPRFGLPSVISDDTEVGRLAARHFLAQRLRSFAVFAPVDTRYAREREQGFSDELAKHGFSCQGLGGRTFFASLGDDSVKENLAAVAVVLNGLPLPCGVFAVEDFKASQLCQIARALGLRVPQDLAVLGVNNDIVVCETCLPPLSSVELGSFRIGYEAAALLFSYLRNGDLPRGGTSLPVKRIRPVRVVNRMSSQFFADPVVARAMRILREEFGTRLKIADLAGRLGVGSRSLESAFQRTLGESPREVLTSLRVDEAISLLDSTDLSFTEIAYRCGFSEYKHFAHQLQKRLGKSASEIRAGGHAEAPQSRHEKAR